MGTFNTLFSRGHDDTFFINWLIKTKTISYECEFFLYCSCRQPYALEHVKPEHLPLNEDAQMIQCYLCDRWYHCSSVGISEERIQELSNSQETWVCKFRGCNTVFHEMFDSDWSIYSFCKFSYSYRYSLKTLLWSSYALLSVLVWYIANCIACLL